MKIKTRFIKSVIEAAAQHDTQMPWTRGARRDGFIACRRQSQTVSVMPRRVRTA
jgi:hypothetical protein